MKPKFIYYLHLNKSIETYLYVQKKKWGKRPHKKGPN